MMTSSVDAGLVDVRGIARFLAEHCSQDIDFGALTVSYLKLRTTGPVLATLQLQTGRDESVVISARWTGQAKGVRLAERLNDHYSRCRRRRDAATCAGLPGLSRAAIYSPDLGVLLSAFPFDRRIPTLAVVADGTQLAGRLERALAPLTDRAEIRHLNVKPVRYKPEGKCVFEIAIDWAEGQGGLPTVVYGKVAKEAIFDRTNRLAPFLAQMGTRTEFVLPRRLAVIEDLSLEVHAQVPGQVMSDLLIDGRTAGLGSAAGIALRSLHGQAVVLPTRRTVDDHKLLLADNTCQLARYRPSHRSTVQYLQAEISRRLTLDTPAMEVVCHNDFHGGNVLAEATPTAAPALASASGMTLGLIDFEDAAMGDPANDVGSFYANLTDLAFRHPVHGRRILAERAEFVNAYDVGESHDRFVCFAAMHCTLLAYQSLRYPGATIERRIEFMLGAATSLLARGQT